MNVSYIMNVLCVMNVSCIMCDQCIMYHQCLVCDQCVINVSSTSRVINVSCTRTWRASRLFLSCSSSPSLSVDSAALTSPTRMALFGVRETSSSRTLRRCRWTFRQRRKNARGWIWMGRKRQKLHRSRQAGRQARHAFSLYRPVERPSKNRGNSLATRGHTIHTTREDTTWTPVQSIYLTSPRSAKRGPKSGGSSLFLSLDTGTRRSTTPSSS